MINSDYNVLQHALDIFESLSKKEGLPFIDPLLDTVAEALAREYWRGYFVGSEEVTEGPAPYGSSQWHEVEKRVEETKSNFRDQALEAFRKAQELHQRIDAYASISTRVGIK